MKSKSLFIFFSSVRRPIILALLAVLFSLPAIGQSGTPFDVPQGNFATIQEAISIVSNYISEQESVLENANRNDPQTSVAKREVEYFVRVRSALEKNVQVPQSIVQSMRWMSPSAANVDEQELYAWRNKAIALLKK